MLQRRSQDFSKGVWGGGGSHCVKQYRHRVSATEYCTFALKKLTKGGGVGSRAPQDPPSYALLLFIRKHFTISIGNSTREIVLKNI